MDIYSGSGICTGENNFFTKFYNSSPVGITVEGSNTLTRGLIIFGQGLNKSHPYIFPIFESIQNNNINEFKKNFNNMLKEILCNYLNLFNPKYLKNNTQNRLDYLTLKFSILTNFIALLGGKIKSKQMISGNMSDILSNLYLGYSLLWYHHHNQHLLNNLNILKNTSLDYLMDEIDYKMNLIIQNYPNKLLYPLLLPLKNSIKYTNLENKNKLYENIVNNKIYNDILKSDIYYYGTVLEKMENLRSLNINSQEYKKMYDEIISVGEYPIQK
jgi:acyl-CoA dehydrogenase